MVKLLSLSAGASLKKSTYPRGHILLQAGDISDKIWWIEEGLLREFFVPENGREVTLRMAGAGTFIYAPKSYLSGEPGATAIEVIEKCRVMAVRQQDIPPGLFKTILRETVLQSEKRLEVLHWKSPVERLEAFERLFPELCNRIPLYYVASFLNITPQTLSRIRGRRTR